MTRPRAARHKLPVPRKRGGIDVDAAAKAAGKKLATLTDIRDIDRFAKETNRIKKIVGEVTGRRTDINKIARPWLNSIIKGGRILTEMRGAGERKGRGGDRKSSSHRASLIPTAKELGFTASRAARWQLVGQLPDQQAETLFSKIEKSPEGILTFAALKLEASTYIAEERRAKSRAALSLADGKELRIGDCREVLADVADNSVSLVLTDPPYGDDAEPLYRWLAEFSARVLIPGGSLICYTGQSTLIRDANIFGERLTYWWPLIMMHTQSQRFLGKFVMIGYRPVLWFVKEHRRDRNLVSDVLLHGDKDKSAHVWGQGVAGVRPLIENLTKPGERIVDPFAGSCLWGDISASMGRRWLGADIVKGGTTTAVAFEQAAE